MLEFQQTLHVKMKKRPENRSFSKKSVEILFLGLVDGNLAELLQVLHKSEGGFTGAGTGGLVSLDDLSFGVDLEEVHRLFDFLYKFFHDLLFLKC